MPNSGRPWREQPADTVDGAAAEAGPGSPGTSGHAVWWRLWRMPVEVSLPTRLLALFLLCLLPVLAVEIYTNIDLRARRQAEMVDLAMRQSELAGGDMGSLVDGTERLIQAIGQFASVRARDPACGGDLVALQRQTPEYAFLAVLGPDDTVLCSSWTGSGGIAPGQRPSWATPMRNAEEVTVGRRTVMPGSDAFLPIALVIPKVRCGIRPCRQHHRRGHRP